MKRRCIVALAPSLFLLAALTCAEARADSPGDVQFNRDVLPILAENCFPCHGFDQGRRQAGLRVDSAEGATAELPSGSRAIVPGDLARSALVQRIESPDPAVAMPPGSTGKELSPAQRATLRQWIEQGALYEPHWAFLPPRSVEPPSVADAGDHPIDRFIRARLAAAGISPAPEADRATLIRRVTLDLTGLPPASLEVEAFVHDEREDAYERVVERLLGSEHFGERWARWWLDLAHYGDSDGYLQDFIRPVAWRYRQWVVEAFNRDLPFDQFTLEQLAGDLLPQATVAQRMGTGFLRNTLSNREGGADLEEYRVNQTLDRTITVATTWLGLTFICAECHDHKFDPISQREFYQFYAFFNQADEVNFDAPLPGEQVAYEAALPAYERRRAELLAPVAERLVELQADWERRLLHAESHPGEDFAWERTLELLGLQWGQNLGEGQLEGLNIIKTPPELRTADQRARLLDYFLRTAPPREYGEPFAELQVAELVAQLDALAKSLPPLTRAPGMMTFPTPRATHVLLRGDFRRPGEEVQPLAPAVLGTLPSDVPADRLALARWLVAPGHPLTARVTVNRLWQELFGRGIVATSDNFGVRGELPSHPELLDWLALEFVERGWSVKELLRRIVTSQTYRQSSQSRPELLAFDPRNALLARQARLRLSGEAIRDAALASSGLLSRTIGGPSVKPPQPESVTSEGYANSWIPSVGAERYRRGLYTWIQRTSPFAQFVTFDLPDLSRSCTRRERSNTPLQALNLLNDPAFLDCARALAARVQREARSDDAARIAHAFVLTLAREPTPAESARLGAYLQQQRALFAADAESARALCAGDLAADPVWIALASVLLNLDEFINRE